MPHSQAAGSPLPLNPLAPRQTATNNEPVAGRIDDVGHQARRRTPGSHHRLADAVVQLVELVMGRGAYREFEKNGHLGIIAAICFEGQGQT